MPVVGGSERAIDGRAERRQVGRVRLLFVTAEIPRSRCKPGGPGFIKSRRTRQFLTTGRVLERSNCSCSSVCFSRGLLICCCSPENYWQGTSKWNDRDTWPVNSCRASSFGHGWKKSSGFSFDRYPNRKLCDFPAEMRWSGRRSGNDNHLYQFSAVLLLFIGTEQPRLPGYRSFSLHRLNQHGAPTFQPYANV